MVLAQPYQISEIDEYASRLLAIPKRELMSRAGRAVADAVRSAAHKGAKVLIFAGKGNNGGDGYAAALLLNDDYEVTVYDVFSAGQRTEEGRFFLESFLSVGGSVCPLSLDENTLAEIREADCTVDAVFGTGFIGEYPAKAVKLASVLSGLEGTVRVAVDVPLGVNASDGSVDIGAAYHADITVALGFVKPGLVSYPAKEYVGKLIYDNIGLQNKSILAKFEFSDHAIDRSLATALLPKRKDNSNKGSFGKLLLVTGSLAFPGAARLSLEAALRSGVGLTTYLGEDELCRSLLSSFPEAIYKPLGILNDSDAIDLALDLSGKHTATLVGSGSSKGRGLYHLVVRLLTSPGSPLILDADAINVLADDPVHSLELIKRAERTVILTPHPLELSRLSGIPTETIQANRLSVAKQFAGENNCILVLKGAATVVTDGKMTYINTSGSSALAKAGSGDVLAGMLASVVASGVDPLSAAALSVYFHGLAADELADTLSELGVTPSDLPREIATQIAKAIKAK